MDTFSHYLRPQLTSRVPSVHICFHVQPTEQPDTKSGRSRRERFGSVSATAFRWEGGAATRRRALNTCSREEFWTWTIDHLTQRRKCWVWTHNAGAQLTWIGLWGQLDKGTFTTSKPILESPPTIIPLSHPSGKSLWLDLMNWFREPLATGPVQARTPRGPPTSPTNTVSLCTEPPSRAVEVICSTVQSILAFVQQNDLGGLKPTAAGQAFSAFRRQIEAKSILIHGDPETSAFEREAYYGGRVEVGFHGAVRPIPSSSTEPQHGDRQRGPVLWDATVHHMDVSSLYPSVMWHNEYPVHLLGTVGHCTVDQLAGLLTTKAVIARVKVQTDRDAYPVRDDRGIYYPVGRYWTTLAGPELAWALERGQIAEVGRTVIYRRADVFTRFVRMMFDLRERFKASGEASWEACVKLIVNGLSGKLGQHAVRWKPVHVDAPPVRFGYWYYSDIETGTWQMRTLAGNTSVRLREAGEGLHSLVAIPAYVTSYGRCLMRRMMDALPPRSLLYTDTDSLHVTDEGRAALDAAGWIDRHTPGKLRLKGVYDCAEYVGQKCWSVPGERHISGIPLVACPAGELAYRWDRWEQLASILSRGVTDEVLVSSIVSDMSGDYTRGVVGEDGWVTPIRLDCDRPEQSSPSL